MLLAVLPHTRGWTYQEVAAFRFTKEEMQLLLATHAWDSELVNMLQEHFKARGKLEIIVGNPLFFCY